MAQLPIYSFPKLNTLVFNKAFHQRLVNFRTQRCVSSCIPPLHSDNITTSVPRRTANYHSDLWSDDVIQTLHTPYLHAPPYQQWADNLVVKVKEMFGALEDGEISPSAYDTAWVAMVPAKDGSHTPQFPQAIKWVISNQVEDGSWGLPSTFLLCDRLLSTLASLVALLTWNTGHTSVEKGARFIEDNLKSLEQEQNISPDFEIIFPALMKKAESLGLGLPYNASLMKKREALLMDISMEQGIPENMLNALEGLEEIIDWKRIMMFQSKDGSFLSSPASTACVLINTGDQKSFSFLSSLVLKFSGCVPCLYPIDLLERLSLVDNIERLGVGRHFEEEIKVALNYVYRYWSEKGIGCGRDSLFADLNSTVLGLRILRIHGYNVSPEVLNNFKDKNGCFFSCSGQRYIEHRSIVNLLRASDIAFPGENIMHEARLFASNYLRKSLTTDHFLTNEKIAKETEYALEYSWHLSISNWEARSYFNAYDENHACLRKTLFMMPYVNNAHCMDLAKLYFNIEQSLHKEELKIISSWWKKSHMAEMDFGRQRMVEWYISVGIFEPKYSLFRHGFTKIVCLLGVIDDIYDTYGTMEELRIFREAIMRWDNSLVDKLPNYMKIVFKAWYKVMNEINMEATKKQGRNMLNQIRKDWEKYINAALQEREWSELGYIPTMEEYFKERCITVGLGPCTHSIFLMGEVLTDSDLSLLQDSSRFFELVALLWRLTNDIATFENEKARGGQEWSFATCYMKQNPGSTEDNAIEHFTKVVDHTLKELNYEYYKSVGEPPKIGKMFYYKMRQNVMLFYKYGDGYCNSMKETREIIMKTLIDPMELW